MNRLLPFALALFAATMFFTACGGDSGSGASDEISVNSSDDEGLDAASSSGKTSKKSSSSKGSSAKSSDGASSADVTLSSSQGRLSSSSVAAGTDRRSSSSVAASSGAVSSSSLKPCSPEDEGEIRTIMKTREDQMCTNGYWVPLSSSSEAESSSSYFDMTNQFNPDVEYGEFTDPRDGQTYRTVSLFDGKYYTDSLVFFAENLNYGKMVAGGTVQGDSTKYCYDDDPWYCENGWGGLYTWSNAMNLPSICDSVRLGSDKCPYVFARDDDGKLIDGEIIHQGLCPDGWHIANDGEWAYIAEKSTHSVANVMGSPVAGFGNHNYYGLSILPGGFWQLNKFDQIKVSAGFYLPQQHDSKDAVARAVYVEKNDFARSWGASKIHALSVRCVKNY